MRKFIIKLLLNWYVGKIDEFEVVKISGVEELKAYTFKDPILTEKLLKSILTAQTLWHFDARSEEERMIAKGAALVLKIIKDSHNEALRIYDSKDIDKSVSDWVKYKRNHRVN